MTRRGGVAIATVLATVLAIVVAACASGSDTPPAAVDTTASSAAPSATAEPSRPADTDPPATDPPDTGTPVADATTTTIPSTNAVPETTPPDTTVAGDGCAASMPLRDRIALLVWPAVYPNEWDTAVRTVGEHRVGGVLLMEPTAWGAGDVAPQLALLDEAAPGGLVIATDEEGGIVQRLSVLGPLPSQQSVSEELDPEAATQLIAEHGERLADAGVDMVLGPVVDVVPETGSVPLTRSRFFTGDPTTVTSYASAYIDGWRASGLTPVVKHFPGHGAASGDTHDEEGVTPALEALEHWDLVPFRALADTGVAVMVGHLTVPGLTDGVPATQSERAVGYLRDELGYTDALVLTDALGMQAVGLPEDEAAVLALAAGADVLLFTATDRTAAVIDAVERAVGDSRLAEERVTESATRVVRQLGRTGCDDS